MITKLIIDSDRDGNLNCEKFAYNSETDVEAFASAVREVEGSDRSYIVVTVAADSYELVVQYHT